MSWKRALRMAFLPSLLPERGLQAFSLKAHHSKVIRAGRAAGKDSIKSRKSLKGGWGLGRGGNLSGEGFPSLLIFL